MAARCGHCGAILDTSTPEAAEHVMQHPPRHSRDERREQDKKRREQRAARALKYWEWSR